MNFRTTIVLVLLLAVVGVGTYFIYQKKEATGDQDKTGQTDNHDQPLLKDLTAASVKTVRLESAGKSAEFSRRDAQWFQTQPVTYPLDHYQADDLVAQAVNLRYTESFEAGSKKAPPLDQAGLAPALARVTLTFDDSKKPARTLELGKQLLGGHAYLKLDNDTHIYIVSDGLHQALLGKANLDDVVASLRDHHLPVPNAGSVDQLTLTRDGPPAQLTKVAGQWMLGAPYLGRASGDINSGDGVGKIVQALRTIYIDKYVADSPPDLTLYGLSKPTAVVRVRAPEFAAPAAGATPAPATQPTSYRTLTVRLGSTTPTDNAYYATWTTSESPAGNSTVVVQIPKDAAAPLLKSVDELRDPRITVVDATDMKQLQVTRPGAGPGAAPGGQTYTLVRGTNGNWTFGAPDPGFKADAEQAGMLADAISSTRARSYVVDFKPTGPPEITMLITSMSRSEPDELKFYAPTTPGAGAGADRFSGPGGPASGSNPESGDALYTVVRNNEPVGYQVPAERLARLREPVGSLRDRVVLDVDPEKITQLTIHQAGVTAGDGLTLVFQRDALPALPALPALTTQPGGSATTQAAGAMTPATQPVLLGPWKLVGQDTFESEALNTLLKRLHPLRATRFLANSAIDVGANRLALTVDITQVDGTKQQVRFDASDPSANPEGRIAGLPPFTVDRSDVEAASVEFRNRTLLPIAAKDIRKVTITERGRTMTVERDDAGTYTMSDGQKLNEALASRLFDTLAGLRAKRYVAALSGSAAGPVRKLTIVLTDGRTYELSLMPGSGLLGQQELKAEMMETSAKPTLLAYQIWSELDPAALRNLQLDPTGKEAPEPMGEVGK